MRLRFCESQIDDLANRYTEKQREDNRERERCLIELQDEIRERGYLTQAELHTLAHWVSPRWLKRTLKNTDDCIRQITTQAFTAPDNWQKLSTIQKLKGIGPARASAILHLYDEQNGKEYPMLTRHSLWSVKLDSIENAQEWAEYIKFCRDIAERNRICMRRLDRALQRYSYENSP